MPPLQFTLEVGVGCVHQEWDNLINCSFGTSGQYQRQFLCISHDRLHLLLLLLLVLLVLLLLLLEH